MTQTIAVVKGGNLDRLKANRTVTLRIKKIFLEEIASGEKKIEYREVKEYYDRLFLTPFDKLKLHYQTSRRLTVEVKKVIINDGLYEIHLGKILENQP